MQDGVCCLRNSPQASPRPVCPVRKQRGNSASTGWGKATIAEIVLFFRSDAMICNDTPLSNWRTELSFDANRVFFPRPTTPGSSSCPPRPPSTPRSGFQVEANPSTVVVSRLSSPQALSDGPSPIAYRPPPSLLDSPPPRRLPLGRGHRNRKKQNPALPQVRRGPTSLADDAPSISRQLQSAPLPTVRAYRQPAPPPLCQAPSGDTAHRRALGSAISDTPSMADRRPPLCNISSPFGGETGAGCAASAKSECHQGEVQRDTQVPEPPCSRRTADGQEPRRDSSPGPAAAAR